MFYILIILYVLISLLTLLLVTFLGLKVYYTVTKGRCKSNATLDGKIALITGGNTGIGFETAKDLAGRGATVIIASRNLKKSARAVEKSITSTGNQKVTYKYLDLAKFSSVRTFAEEIKKSYDRLDILINNAGTGGLKHQLTDDGIDIVTQVNYFGPYLLTNLLLDKVISAKPSRIIIVSSSAHFYANLDLEDLKVLKKMSSFTIYANSKLCNVLWAKALTKNLPDEVTVNVLHPGIVNTELLNRCGPLLSGFLGLFCKSAEEGAQTCIHLAVANEVKHTSGRYFVDCQIAEESKMAENEDLIKIVWEKSFVITNTK